MLRMMRLVFCGIIREFGPSLTPVSYIDIRWANMNPSSFYMKYAPDEEGNFAGQTGYGYISFEKFVDAVNQLNAGKVSLEQLDSRPIPTLKNTIATTAILEAGRRSLDEGRPVEIVEKEGVWELK